MGRQTPNACQEKRKTRESYGIAGIFQNVVYVRKYAFLDLPETGAEKKNAGGSWGTSGNRWKPVGKLMRATTFPLSPAAAPEGQHGELTAY